MSLLYADDTYQFNKVGESSLVKVAPYWLVSCHRHMNSKYIIQSDCLLSDCFVSH